MRIEGDDSGHDCQSEGRRRNEGCGELLQITNAVVAGVTGVEVSQSSDDASVSHIRSVMF